MARRWQTITKLAKCLGDELPEPDAKKIENLVKNKKRLAKIRKRLSDISLVHGYAAARTSPAARTRRKNRAENSSRVAFVAAKSRMRPACCSAASMWT